MKNVNINDFDQQIHPRLTHVRSIKKSARAYRPAVFRAVALVVASAVIASGVPPAATETCTKAA